MATITAGTNIDPAVAAPAAPAVRTNRRVAGLRSQMLFLMASALAFGVLAGLIAWQANVAAYNSYHKLVDEGSVSVDAALRARAAALDHMGAAATFLETKGEAQQAARAQTTKSWLDYQNESRVSWRNLTDSTHGENTVLAAADSAAGDYIQQIGAMFAYHQTNQIDQAGASFLVARETLNTRLVPALGGLESVKVEDMEVTYAGAEQRITRWRYALIGVAVLLLLIFAGAIFAVRRMHYRWSWPVGAALLFTAGLALVMQFQLGQASADARVLVREAYDNVAGVQDLSALLSQGRALESIAIFDAKGAQGHLSSFDQYNLLVEQKLCGPRDCTNATFLAGGDLVSPQVQQAAENEQGKLGLPRLPLIANVHFPGQAAKYEAVRVDYRAWLDAHTRLRDQINNNQLDAASSTSTNESAKAFSQLETSVAAAGQVARDKFNSIWGGVYNSSTLNQALALLFPICGVLTAFGLWQRRSELFA